MNELAILDTSTGEIVQWSDNTEDIAKSPIRITWDVREKSPAFVGATGEEPFISGQLLSASYLYACWSDQVGQPYCMGSGKQCPDHPDTSDSGIGLVLHTYQFGAVYMQCFGLMKNWAQGLVRLATNNGSEFETSSPKSIPTKHGTMNIPGLVK